MRMEERPLRGAGTARSTTDFGSTVRVWDAAGKDWKAPKPRSGFGVFLVIVVSTSEGPCCATDFADFLLRRGVFETCSPSPSSSILRFFEVFFARLSLPSPYG